MTVSVLGPISAGSDALLEPKTVVSVSPWLKTRILACA